MTCFRSSLALVTAGLTLAVGPSAFARPPAHAWADDMVSLPAGQFIMGSSQAQSDHEQTQTMHTGSAEDDFGPREKPQHAVRVPAFLISKYLVTRADYAAFVAATSYAAAGCYAYTGVRFGMSATADWRSPGFDQTDRDPVLCVSYNDALAYLKWYSGKTGQTFRLPTEAEMEYATRAGTTTSRFWGEDVAKQCEYANGADLTMKKHFPEWYGAPCEDGYLFTSPVGSFKPNPWGLYDMVGEAFEMTADCWHETYVGAPEDGSAWTTAGCSKHTVRGGSTSPHPGSMTSTSRVAMPDTARTVYVGFRMARSVH